MIRVVKNLLFEELVFFVALIAAIATGYQRETHWEAIDFSILMVLSTLMLIALAFEKYHLLDHFALGVIKRADSERKTALWMIGVTAFLAIWITNDVALITVVPITLKISKKLHYDPYKVIVLEAIAANIASSLTPFGNPQNLYLYNRYGYNLLEFVGVVLPFVLIGFASLLLFVWPLSGKKLGKSTETISKLNWRSLSVYMISFVVAVVLIVLRGPIEWAFIFVVIWVFIKDKELFPKLDYFLLGTFVCFFIFVDHVEQMTWIHPILEPFLKSDQWLTIASALLSQIISNVPSAIVLSAFTQQPDALLLGVSIGGVGTLVASLANLIAYKFYVKAYPKSQYHSYFIVVNGVLLVFFLFIFGALL